MGIWYYILFNRHHVEYLSYENSPGVVPDDAPTAEEAMLIETVAVPEPTLFVTVYKKVSRGGLKTPAGGVYLNAPEPETYTNPPKVVPVVQPCNVPELRTSLEKTPGAISVKTTSWSAL